MVCCLHAYTDIRYLFIDSFLCTFSWFVGKYHITISFIRHEVSFPEASNKSSKSLTHVKKIYLGPQINQAIRRRTSGKTDYSFYSWPCFPECLKAFTLMTLKRAQLINHYAIKSEISILNQPANILTIHNINKCWLC